MWVRVQKMLDLTSSTQSRTVSEKSWNSGPTSGPETRKNKILGSGLNESAVGVHKFIFSSERKSYFDQLSSLSELFEQLSSSPWIELFEPSEGTLMFKMFSSSERKSWSWCTPNPQLTIDHTVFQFVHWQLILYLMRFCLWRYCPFFFTISDKVYMIIIFLLLIIFK